MLRPLSVANQTQRSGYKLTELDMVKNMKDRKNSAALIFQRDSSFLSVLAVFTVIFPQWKHRQRWVNFPVNEFHPSLFFLSDARF